MTLFTCSECENSNNDDVNNIWEYFPACISFPKILKVIVFDKFGQKNALYT